MDYTLCEQQSHRLWARCAFANQRFALAEQSALFVLVSELSDTNWLDYHGLRPCGLTAKREITARAIIKDFDASVNIPRLAA